MTDHAADRTAIDRKVQDLVDELTETGLRKNASARNTRAAIERRWPRLPKGIVTLVVLAYTGGTNDGRVRPTGRPRGS